MKQQVNPRMIILAREAVGITQIELAEKVGLNQANVSRIENGFISASEELINKIANILGFPIACFFTPGNVVTPQIHFYRKSAALPIKSVNQIKAMSIIDRLRIDILLRSVEINVDVPCYELDEYESPEAIAQALRKHWKVPRGPILNLTSLLESNGIIVIPINFGSRLISDVTPVSSELVHTMFINSLMPPDRSRFTLAHALGHLVMHKYSKSEIIEREADRFAGEFLMPAEDILHQLRALSIERLSDLKRYWKVSMQALLMRAGQLNTITKSQSQYLWKKISALGFRLSEPADPSIIKEEPQLLTEIVNLHRKELNYSEANLKRLLFLRDSDLQTYGFSPPSRLKLVHQKN